ncbi:MAG: exodeoxyribonuclease VII small subunit [Tissierellia bacterium]|nr:exodeoxyribonuclease VII small subunit [Tissierellia bacterium]
MKENFSYEHAMEEIKVLLEKLESSEFSLEENLSYFKKAESLIQQCELYLNKVEKEIETIIHKEHDEKDGDLGNESTGIEEITLF